MHISAESAIQIRGFLFNASSPVYVIPRVVVSVAAFELGAYLEYAKCSKLTKVCMASASF